MNFVARAFEKKSVYYLLWFPFEEGNVSVHKDIRSHVYLLHFTIYISPLINNTSLNELQPYSVNALFTFKITQLTSFAAWGDFTAKLAMNLFL